MKIRRIIMTLPVVAVLCSCQSEAPQIDTTPQRVLTVRASLPESDTRSDIAIGNTDLNTRTQITYGNPDRSKELFEWSEEDEIFVFNITRLYECPDGISMLTSKIEGRTAEFTVRNDSAALDPTNFKIKAGDILFVSYWTTERKKTFDDRKIFTIYNSYEKPQLILENPQDPAYMSYMQGSLRMYDIVTAVKDNEFPDLHFKHLSAIMRVTLRNETGEDIWPKVLSFECPGKAPFCNNTIYCSVDTVNSDEMRLNVYDDSEFYDTSDGSKDRPYTDIVNTNINNYTAAETEKGGPLKNGETYNLYLTCVPRIDNTIKGEKLIISLDDRSSSSESEVYDITLESFNTPIEAGKRYWFNLTAVKDGEEKKLMLTSEWEDLKKQQQEQNPDNGDQNSSGD